MVRSFGGDIRRFLAGGGPEVESSSGLATISSSDGRSHVLSGECGPDAVVDGDG